MSRPAGGRWRIGLVGCGWISEVYHGSLSELPEAGVVACCAGSPESARRFAEARGIPNACDDWQSLVARDDVDVVAVGVPNRLHHPVTIAALEAGKHVIVEKPLATSLEECREIVETARRTGKVVGYAENLCFAPKYIKTKELIGAGDIGEVRFLKHVEKHDGPHTRWFYEAESAGGGALMDMGCHSVELVRWLLDKPAVTAVWAHMDTLLHREGLDPKVTELEDHCVLHLEFETGASALLESGWSLKGGMASRLELQGTAGVLHTDMLLEGSGMKIFTEAGEEPGWRSVDADWQRQNGYPQQLAHFLRCMETGEAPEEGAADGLAVMEIMLAAYYSAGTGRKVALPFRPEGVRRPVDLWKNPPQGLDA